MNYTELKNAALAYADRNDIDVINNVDVFMVMAEARMNRLLKTRKQSTRIFTGTVTDQEYYRLPPDYAGMRDIQLNSANPREEHSSCPMEMLSPVLFNSQRNQPYGGKLYYSIIADQIQIYPVQAAGLSIEITYYQKVPNLNETDNENWMATDHPDVYLAGLTAEIELFAKNYDVADGWIERMGIAMKDLENSDTEERWSGAPLVMRTA